MWYAQQIRGATRAPLAVGFGISTPDQATGVGRMADGVIVGSAVINAASGERPVEGVREFVRNLKGGLR